MQEVRGSIPLGSTKFFLKSATKFCLFGQKSYLSVGTGHPLRADPTTAVRDGATVPMKIPRH